MLSPSAIMEGVTAYTPPPLPAPGTLKVDFNEGVRPGQEIQSELAAIDPDALRRYPDARALTAALATRWGLTPDRVLVTAGGDDALFRICRAMLDPTRSAVMTDPTFEMIPRYARLSGARLHRVPWLSGAFPLQSVIAAADDSTGAVFVVSPNNPTGLSATTDDLRTLSQKLPGSLIVLDAAYGEFDPGDLTATALELPNVVTVRTFSKAYGLAALRVGYALGTPEVVRWLNAAGNPFPCAQPSLNASLLALRDEHALKERVTRVNAERDALLDLLDRHGVNCPRSRGNFVLAMLGERAEAVDRSLIGSGVLVRRFAPPSPVAGALRITCPGSRDDFERLRAALERALSENPA